MSTFSNISSEILLFPIVLLLLLSPSSWAEWGDVRNLGSVLNSQFLDAHPCISADGQTLCFGSERPGGEGDRDVWISQRIGWSGSGPIWSSPRNPGPPLNSSSFDGHPHLSPDGQVLYFTSSRPGGFGNTDIWVTERSESGWGEPVNFGYPINTAHWEMGPHMLDDGNVLYFSSDRPAGFGDHDIYKSSRLNDEWSEPENVGASVNTPLADIFPWVDPGEQILYYGSWGHGGYGLGDIYESHWTGWAWGEPFNLGSGINTEAGESSPFLAPDGSTLFFHSNRSGGFGDYDLYQCFQIPEEWGESVNLGRVLNSPQYDGQPSISIDGTTLYFGSERPGCVGDRDIWVSKLLGWSAQGPFWSPPKNPGTPLNSVHFDSDPCISQDGRLLYFMSSRPPGSWSNPEIWVSQWIDGIGWGEPTILPAPINSPYWDRNPQISPDGQTLYFSSVRPGGFGDYDIYRSTRLGSSWSEPENLGPGVNTAYNDNAPWINAGQTVLYFNSPGHGAMGEEDIFRSVWTGSEWSDPVSLGDGVNTSYSEGSASLTPDMGLLYYHSFRPGGQGDNDIWLSVSSGVAGYMVDGDEYTDLSIQSSPHFVFRLTHPKR